MTPSELLSKVGFDIMKAIRKRRCVPEGYAVFVVVARRDPEILRVWSAPPQDPDVVKFMLREAAAHMTGAVEVSEVTCDGSIKRFPTGNA